MTGGALEFVRNVVGGEDWLRVLEFADRTQMTLLLGDGPQPAWVREAIAIRAAKNADRLRRLRSEYDEISTGLGAQGIDFVLLKGLSHAVFGIDSGRRVQYDIDLFCESRNAGAALLALRALGYAFHSQDALSDQHLPPLVKGNQWRWSGDYFDLEMPIAVEVHTTLWERETDRLESAGVTRFPERRDPDTHWLALPDRISYAALHALRHILRNDARPAHVFELACMLETLRYETAVWEEWIALNSESERRLQAVAFRFAVDWFGCAAPEPVAREISRLGARVETWFQAFGLSPATNLVRPNKAVVWLHLALLDSKWDRFAVLRRRLFPAPRMKTHGATVGARVRHHASTIAPALANGLRWWFRSAAS